MFQLQGKSISTNIVFIFMNTCSMDNPPVTSEHKIKVNSQKEQSKFITVSPYSNGKIESLRRIKRMEKHFSYS